MHLHLTSWLVIGLMFVPAVVLPAVAGERDAVRLGSRIQVAPPRLALLAGQMERLGAAARWDFASITLDVLLESYQAELREAAREPARSPERRAKLARWQRATAELAGRIRDARLRLLDGATFSVYADPLHQVLVIVDGTPISVSGPRPDGDLAIEERIIDQFCAYNDCSALASSEADVVTPGPMDAPGSWVLGQQIPPTFEIYGVMRCEFGDIAGRARKAEACRLAADEARGLSDAIQQAQRRGYRVDWEWLKTSPPRSASAGQVVVNSEGAYLALPSAALVRLSASDWRDLVAWLRDRDSDIRRIAVLKQADRLLGSTAAR